MPSGLTIGTERAAIFQQAIQDELTRRGYSPDADPVMAEYITIMVINNKTPAQITTELEDLISTEIDPSFISWLFEEAAKGSSGPELATPASPAPASEVEPANQPGPSHEMPAHSGDSTSRRQPGSTHNGVYQQAISQMSHSPSAQKRSASARSPSPSHPNKSRKTDLPTGPRAMQKEGPSGSRSLLDRMSGGPQNRLNGHSRDEIQRRIDSVTGNAPDPGMMIPPGFPGLPPGMDMNMAANMVNPLVLQEMMVNQMAMMAQMASTMGILNPNTGQFSHPGFPMQNGMPVDMAMMQNNGFQGQGQGGGQPGRGRGNVRGRNVGRGRGGVPPNPAPHVQEANASAPPVVAPVPIAPAPVAATTSELSEAKPTGTYAIPERPQSPTLCKYGTKCSNAHCRYSHPSPVATAESGIVLSNEPCEQGKDCKDKDCTKAHVSPSVLNPNSASSVPNASQPPSRPTPQAAVVHCRFGLACTRPGCSFSHPPRQSCRFGTGCTRANCTFQHPPGRVLPSTFHRGLSTSGPMVNVTAPETGSMGPASHNRSVTFNNPSSVKEKLQKQMKEIEEKKEEMEKAMREAAANSKKIDSKPVALPA